MIIPCKHCQGEGRIFQSRYGGNDPDVWGAGRCNVCDGSGTQPCETPECPSQAVGINRAGDALCADCSAEWDGAA